MNIRPSVSNLDPINLYKEMLLIRRIEEALVREYPKQEMRCPVHFSIGQEAIAVGVSALLTKSDWVVSNHRSHAHYIAKQGNLFAFISELYGKESGCCAGRGGSMHLTDMDAGFLAGIPIVGSALPIAAGVAMSQKWQGAEDITVVYIGDAAVESGSFHETLNFASLHGLPLLTICENNEYSIFTPLSVRQPSNRTIGGLAESHGLRSFYGNGDDVLEVIEVVEAAISYMKLESKPAFIEFRTYRLLEHCGPNFDDYLNYRDSEEISQFEKRDPVAILHNRLLNDNPIMATLFAEFEAELGLLIKDLILNAKLAPLASYSLENTTFWKSI
jgi:TPP-dependent pyruvate/acetoin dehydrogenase alpha subunit